jgi:hypothetical protein
MIQRSTLQLGEQAWATVQRGMVDELIHLTTGADVQVGQRLGTGDFFQQTAEKLMGYSQYGDKTTPADMLGGATYSVFGEAIGSAFALVPTLGCCGNWWRRPVRHDSE